MCTWICSFIHWKAFRMNWVPQTILLLFCYDCGPRSHWWFCSPFCFPHKTLTVDSTASFSDEYCSKYNHWRILCQYLMLSRNIAVTVSLLSILVCVDQTIKFQENKATQSNLSWKFKFECSSIDVNQFSVYVCVHVCEWNIPNLFWCLQFT